MIIIRLIYLYDGPSPDDLIKKTKENKKLSLNIETSSESSPSIQRDPIINKIYNQDNDPKEKREASMGNILEPIGVLTINSYRHFVDLFYQKKEGMLHTYLYNTAKLVSFKEGEVVVNTKSIVDPHFTRTVAKLVSKWTGRIWQVSTSTSNVGQTLYEKDLIKQQKEIEIMKNEPEVRTILSKFPGVNVHSITDIFQTTDEIVLKIKNKQTKEK